jgi:dolichol-phosphate mannosyltransferase
MSRSLETRRALRIVIPAYDEEARIAPTLADYCETFAGVASIVVVANGCSDGTAAVVRELADRYDNLALIDIPSAIGKGGAVRVGLATGDEAYAGFVDADGSTSAAEFARLFAALQRSGSDAVVGSRWMPGARIEPPQPASRRLASRVFNAIVRTLFGLSLRDTQCGAKVFRREALSRVLGKLEIADFAFDIEVLWRLKMAGCTLSEVPTAWSDRAAGTKIQLGRSSWSMLKSVLRLRLRETPLWRMPLVDRFGETGLIPVRRNRRILLLGAPGPDSADAPLEAFFACLRDAGIELARAETEMQRRTVSPLQFLWWYAFESRRDYDAVMEIVGRGSWIVTRFSAKPLYTVATPAHPVSAQAHRRATGQRGTLVDLSLQSAPESAEIVLATAWADAMYTAVFRDTAAGLSLQYADIVTGARTNHVL